MMRRTQKILQMLELESLEYKTVLTGKDTWLSKDIELSLEIICRLGLGGVLEEDEGELRSLVDSLVTGLRCASLIPESDDQYRCRTMLMILFRLTAAIHEI
jgi:hypothetical protein